MNLAPQDYGIIAGLGAVVAALMALIQKLLPKNGKHKGCTFFQSDRDMISRLTQGEDVYTVPLREIRATLVELQRELRASREHMLVDRQKWDHFMTQMHDHFRDMECVKVARLRDKDE